MRRTPSILLLALLVAALPVGLYANDNEMMNSSPDKDQDMQDIVQELIAVVSSRDEPSFDVSYESDQSELRRIIVDHGYDADSLLSDFSFITTLSAASGIFKSGDARRWTTLNFVYQLACYQGREGSLFSKAWWVFTTYNGYACYCGAGEYSGNYLDATDNCCKHHDNCYTRVQKKYNLSFGCQTYTLPYSVSCCNSQKITKCTDKGPSAGRELCECDQAMSSCVAKHRGTYNKAYYDNRSKCNSGTKSMSAWQILKGCRNIFKPRVTFPIKYGSQGTCPAKKKRGWWWGKK